MFSAKTGLLIEVAWVDRLAVSKFVAYPAQCTSNTYKLPASGLLSGLPYPLPLGIYTRPYSCPSCNIYYFDSHNRQLVSKLRDGLRQSRSSRSEQCAGRYLVSQILSLQPTIRRSLLTTLRAGLPSKTQTYYFFLIDQARVKEFRKQLAHLIPLITTTAQTFGSRKTISQEKSDAAKRGVPGPLLKLSGVNIAFSHKGLQKVSRSNFKC